MAISMRASLTAAFTLGVRSVTLFLFFWFYFSRRVAFAFTIAIDSFIFGTWSFRSRMFCSRISSGSSAAEIIQPNIERKTRFMRCHIWKASRKSAPPKHSLRSLARTAIRARHGVRVRRAGRALSRLEAGFWARRAARAGDRPGPGGVRARPRRATSGDRPGGHRGAAIGLRADPGASPQAGAAKSHGAPWRCQAAAPAIVSAALPRRAARAVPGPLVEEATLQAPPGRRGFRPPGAPPARARRTGGFSHA